jgi:hypothetical protein
LVIITAVIHATKQAPVFSWCIFLLQLMILCVTVAPLVVKRVRSSKAFLLIRITAVIHANEQGRVFPWCIFLLQLMILRVNLYGRITGEGKIMKRLDG